MAFTENYGGNACTQKCAGCPVTFADGAKCTIAKNPRLDAEERFPTWLQPFITLISGKPSTAEAEADIEEGDPVERVLGNVIQLAWSTGAICVATTAITPLSVPLALIGSLFAVGALRDFQLSVSHEASHFSFFPKKQKKQMGQKWRFWNELVLGFSSTLALSANGADYRGEHGPHHRFDVFMTPDDPDAALLLKLGFLPGMSVRRLWWQLAKTAVSPAYHGMYMWARIRSNVVTAKGWRRVAGVSWLAVLAGLAFVMPFWTWFLAIFMVWGPLWQISALLQFCSEHPWLSYEGSAETREAYAEGCHARFSWLPMPSKNLRGWAKAKAWTIWSARMLTVEIPSRVAVVPNTLAAHDAHHLAPWNSYDLSDWVNSHIHREKMIRQGDTFGMSRREHYGIGSAINRVFTAISKAKPV